MPARARLSLAVMALATIAAPLLPDRSAITGSGAMYPAASAQGFTNPLDECIDAVMAEGATLAEASSRAQRRWAARTWQSRSSMRQTGPSSR
jgi:hypothetical protein